MKKGTKNMLLHTTVFLLSLFGMVNFIDWAFHQPQRSYLFDGNATVLGILWVIAQIFYAAYFMVRLVDEGVDTE